MINKGYVYNSITNVYYKGTESAFNQAKIDEAAFYLGQQSNLERIKELEDELNLAYKTGIDWGLDAEEGRPVPETYLQAKELLK